MIQLSRSFRRSTSLTVIYAILSTFAVLIATPSNVAFAADSAIDASFGTSGFTIGGTQSAGGINAIATDSLGRIVAGGSVSNGGGSFITVSRYLSNGSVDTSFGINGFTTLASLGGTYDQINALAIDSSDRIIAVGYDTFANNQGYNIVLMRFTTGGVLDTTFGTNGVVKSSISGASPYGGILNALVIDSSGRIIVGGFTTGPYKFLLARYTSAGVLDNTFGSSGYTTTTPGSTTDAIFSLALDGDGKILAAGESIGGGGYRFAIGRYSANGIIDTTYGTSGFNTSTAGAQDKISSIKLDSAGRVVAGGNSLIAGVNKFTVARYTTSGSLDTSFGTNGFNTTTPGTDDRISSISIDSRGRILAGGRSKVSGSFKFTVARYTATGAVDGMFGTNGFDLTTPTNATGGISALLLDSEGKIVVGGSSTVTQSEWTIGRFANPEHTLGSVCFNNSSTQSYINLNHAENAVGTGDYTLEMWAKLPSGTPVSTLVNGHSVYNGTSTLSLFTDGNPGGGNGSINTTGSITSPGNIPANTWFHVAYVRTGTAGSFFVNGVPRTYNGTTTVTSVTDTKNYTSTNFRVGFPLTGTWPGGFNSCLAGIALTKSALYSSNFSANLPYPSTRVMPANSVIFLNPTLDGIYNTGTGATPVTTGSVTVNSDLPSLSSSITIASASITGSASYNQTLTAAAGTVSNSASYTTSYQWRRAGSAITGATNSTYTLTSADIGNSISVVITVTDGSNSAFASSAGTAVVSKLAQTATFTTLTTVDLGQSNTLEATLAPGVTGTVTFKDASNNTLCTTSALNSSGVASCAWTPIAAGTYVVKAHYSGDTYYSATTSATQSVSVRAVITYDLNNGVGTTPTQSIYSGSALTLPAGTGLSKSGYTFGGWSLTETGTAVTSPYSPSASRTLYAVWTGNQYTITYNANGGTGTQTAGSYTTGAAATSLPATSTFTRTGYSFGGWATSASSTTPVTSYSTSANATFYAIWTRGTYNVRFLANGGVGTMETQTSSATANLTANTFTYADRTFTGWNTSADGTGTSYSNSQSYPFLTNLTLYARWGNVITFSSQGATSGSPSRTSEGWTSGSINLPTVGTMVKAGYTFSGWTTGSQTYAGGASYTPTAGITFNPVWTANTYTISYNSNQATGGTLPSNQSWATGSTALTLSGNTGTLVKSGYTFGGWATTATSTTPVTTYSTSANQIFYAIWTPVSYTIAYALAGGTSALPTQENKRIGNQFTLAGTPTRASYNFAGWSDSTTAYSAGATYTITASTPSAVTLTAQWIPIYTVSYILNGSTDSVTAPAFYDSGTVISLAAAPSLIGHNFAGWVDSGNNLRAASSSFTVVENSTLQARWTAIPYSVTYNLGGASGTLPLQSSLTINQSFPVATTPIRAGYIFNGWNNGSETYTAGSTYVIASSNVTLTAQWAAIEYAVTFDLGGGVGTLPTQANGSIGSTFALPSAGSNPTKLAHTFTGWSDGSALYAAGATYTFSAAAVTLTAQFSQNGYTKITYSLGSGAGIAPIQASVLEGTTITIASGALVTRANYAFAGWSNGSNDYAAGASYVVGPESTPVTFTPNWTSGYNVTYSTGSGFGIAPVDTVGRITGSTFTVASSSTVSRQGFTFTGWSDGTNVVQPGATYTVASSNITLTAQWVQNSLVGIPSSALTPLASFSIVNGVGPIGGFNFGSSSVSYEIPVNALSAGTVISIYGLTDFSSLAGMVPSGKTVISSTVISWLGTDGTVQDTNSPIKMTITDSQIVPGSVVYAVTGGELTLLGTATTNGSITTTIVSDPVILIANPVVTNTNPPSSGGGNVAPAPAPAPVVDNSAAIAAAQVRMEAEKKAAEEAAALKVAVEAKALADAKAAEEEAALKVAQEKMAADAKALAEAKAAADAAAIKAAQDAADASAKAAAALQAAKDAEIAAANAAKAIKPAVTLYSLSSTLKLGAYDSAYLNKYVKSLKNGASVTCIGYSYSKNTTLKKAIALAKSQATAVCALMKKTNKTLKTSVVVYPATKAPKAATGAKWVGVSYRIDGFKSN